MVLAVKCLVCSSKFIYSPKELINHVKNEHPELVKAPPPILVAALIEQKSEANFAADTKHFEAQMDDSTFRKKDKVAAQRISDDSDSDVLTVPLKTLRQLKAQDDQETQLLAEQDDGTAQKRAADRPGIRKRIDVIANKHAKIIKGSSTAVSRDTQNHFLGEINCINCAAFKRPIVKSHAKSVARKSSLLATIWMTCCQACFPQSPYQDLYCTDCGSQVGVFDPEKQKVFVFKATDMDS
jgi:hypothetical protein